MSRGDAVRTATAAVLGLAILAGCEPGAEPAPVPDGAAAGPPSRVVVMAPAAAEMLDALGLLDRVVGIGDFGPWPDALAGLPSAGSYDSPNVEQVLSLDCDLLITTASRAGIDAHARLESLGVPVLSLDTSTYEGVFDSLAGVGRAFRAESAASAVEERLRARMDEVAEAASGLPSRRVLFVVGRDPLYVAGPGSHIDELIRLVGGENVAHDALTPYQQVSLETILERMPEVIVDASDNRGDGRRGRGSEFWSAWPFLPAVRDDRVYAVEPGRLVIPGIRLPEMAELMARLVHPEVFGEPTDDDLGVGGGA